MDWCSFCLNPRPLAMQYQPYSKRVQGCWLSAVCWVPNACCLREKFLLIKIRRTVRESFRISDGGVARDWESRGKKRLDLKSRDLTSG